MHNPIARYFNNTVYPGSYPSDGIRSCHVLISGSHVAIRLHPRSPSPICSPELETGKLTMHAGLAQILQNLFWALRLSRFRRRRYMHTVAIVFLVGSKPNTVIPCFMPH